MYQSPQILSHLIEFRDRARSKLIQRLNIRLHYLLTGNADTVRAWLNASPRYRVTKRDALNYVLHQYEASSEPMENWDLYLYLYTQGNCVRVEFMEGGVPSGYTDVHMPEIVGSTEFYSTDPTHGAPIDQIEPLEIVVSSPAWLAMKGQTCT
jgi:hypothetical protein